MRVSELIAKLQGVVEKDGDINIYVGDMEAPRLEVNETVDSEDVQTYGEKYLTIEY